MSSCVLLQAKRGREEDINALFRVKFGLDQDHHLVVGAPQIFAEMERIQKTPDSTYHHIIGSIKTISDWNLALPERRLGSGSIPIAGFIFDRDPEEARAFSCASLSFVIDNLSMFRDVRHLDHAYLAGLVSSSFNNRHIKGGTPKPQLSPRPPTQQSFSI